LAACHSFLWPEVSAIALYFHLDDFAPVLRCWASAPRIGDTIALPEMGGNLNPLKVYDVVWEGYDEPSVSVFLHKAKVDYGVLEDPESLHERAG
jgi:hypothetical protein